MLILLDTENWQVNYLAWLTLGKPLEIALFSSPRRIRDGRAKQVVDFFEGKGCRASLIEEFLQPDDEDENYGKVRDWIMDAWQKNPDRSRIVLFRTGGTKFMGEGALLAFRDLTSSTASRDESLRRILFTAGINENNLYLSGPNNFRDKIVVNGEGVTLADLEKISGYRLGGGDLWFDGFAGGVQSQQVSDRIHEELQEFTGWCDLELWLRDFRGPSRGQGAEKKRKDQNGEEYYEFQTRAERYESIREMLYILLQQKPGISFSGRSQGQCRISQETLQKAAVHLNCESNPWEFRGFLFERIIARHHLRRALEKETARSFHCYLDVKPNIGEAGGILLKLTISFWIATRMRSLLNVNQVINRLKNSSSRCNQDWPID